MSGGSTILLPEHDIWGMTRLRMSLPGMTAADDTTGSSMRGR